MRITFQRDYYRNGQLMQELPKTRGLLHGLVRTWHRNGQLASRTRFVYGMEHGLARQWDEKGKLLGEYRMKKGTGVVREWHENGQPKVEIPMLDGEFHGRSRRWLIDGTLCYENFYIEGQALTRSAYVKATKNRADLPLYKDLEMRGYRKPKVSEAYIEDLHIRTLLADPRRVEAREWLTSHPEKKATKKVLGGFKSQRKALEFVESLYRAGARSVVIPGIYSDKKGNQFADACLVELPKQKVARAKVRRCCLDSSEREAKMLKSSRHSIAEFLILAWT